MRKAMAMETFVTMEPIFSLPPAFWTMLTLAVAFLGACVGSFLNVCIYRIPRELSVVRPRSHCPHCNRLIPWYLNVPVLSYLVLRGRCRYCREPISYRYLLVELLTALLFVMIWIQAMPLGASRPLGLTPLDGLVLAPVFWLFAAGLILGTFVDLDHMIIPDRVSLGGIAAGLLLSVVVPAMHQAQSWQIGLLRSAVGMATGWGVLWLVATVGTWIFRKEAMGFGDVKLMGAIGAFLGWRAVLFTLMVSSLLGSVAGAILLAIGNRKLQSRIPYGPYLALAAMLWLFWGIRLWQVYLSLLRPAA